MPETTDTRLALVERDQQAIWRRYDDMHTEIGEHHAEDDARFKELNAKLDGLRNQYVAILASIVASSLMLLIAASVAFVKVASP